MMRKAAVLAACLCLGSAASQAYLKLGSEVGDRIIPLKWSDLPVRYAVTDRDVPGVDALDLEAAVRRAFATWAAVPASGVSSDFIGFTDSDPFVEDDVSVIGFRSRPDLERTLGATTFTLDRISGRVLESDIFLNSTFSKMRSEEHTSELQSR